MRCGLHKAIAGEKNGGVGPGVSPKTALAVGLKVDAEALPAALVAQIKAGKVNLDDPATTIALLKLNAVVGVTAFTTPDGGVKSMGIQCALCHSTVDDSFAPGIGKRLDGWANRDLNVGAIVALAPNLQAVHRLAGRRRRDREEGSGQLGPGPLRRTLDKDGKAFRPDGKQAGTLIPPAFGLAGVNLHTWTGWGSVPYWNAYVAATEMHGHGTFYDARLAIKTQFAVSAKSGSCNTRDDPGDRTTEKLPALHFYQLSIPAPRPPAGIVQRGGRGEGQGAVHEQGKLRALPRAAALHRAGQQHPRARARSASIRSRPIARRPRAIARRRSRACGRTRRAASITTAASPRWPTSSITTTRSFSWA